MKKTTTRRALFLGLAAMFLCFVMLLGTTYAWFTDSVTSELNTIIAGNLDIELYNGSDKITGASTDPKFFDDVEKWEPGAMAFETFTVTNEGTLALKYSLEFEAIEPANGISIAKALKIAQTTASIDTSAGRIDPDNYEWKSFSSFSFEGELAEGDTQDHTFIVWWEPSDDDNNYNMNNTNSGKAASIDFKLNLYATQKDAETDSFGPDYDKDLLLPATSSENKRGGERIVAGNVAVTIYDDAEDALYTLSIDNQRVETNNNETTVYLDIDLIKNGEKATADAGKSYTVQIDIGKGRIVTALNHNGTAITDYSYDPATGILTFATESFSPFSFAYSENVVKVSDAKELIAVLSGIKTEAKLQIPGENGNKQYRENVIIVLEDDIVINSSDDFMYTDSNGAPLHFYGVKGVLDLNGHSITVTPDALLSGKAHANAVILVQYSNISIIGEGSIVAQNKSIPVYAWANGSVDIYSGNYVTNAYERNESSVYVNNASITVNVYGGTFTESAYAFNVHDNCGTTPVIVLHEGISYSDFFKGTTDLIASDINKGRIVIADGCELVEYEENSVAMNKVVAK